jgi:peptide deformylase
MKILTEPNPLLNEISQEVLFPLSPANKKLVEDMLYYVETDDISAGLAAPQVGELKRIIVVSDKTKTPYVMINPRITLSSNEVEDFPEGCLSIPNKQFVVERPKTIKVQYQDTKGRLIVEKAVNWQARLIQHEVDHLNGVLISSKGRLVGKKEAQEIVNQYYDTH